MQESQWTMIFVFFHLVFLGWENSYNANKSHCMVIDNKLQEFTKLLGRQMKANVLPWKCSSAITTTLFNLHWGSMYTSSLEF